MPDPLDELTPRQELAKAGLLEITSLGTIGDPAGEIDEGDGVVTYLFDTTMAGYPGWKWTVSVAQVDGSEPTVLETELTPADGALLSPDWVPWSDRMDDYRAAQIDDDGDNAGESDDDSGADDADSRDSDDDDSDEDDSDEDDSDDDSDDDEDDSDDDDDDDSDDEFDNPVLHSGDLDGVDIDEIDINDDDDDSDDDEDDSDDDDDESGDPASEEFPVIEVVVTEPVASPVNRARRSRRATSASVAQDAANQE